MLAFSPRRRGPSLRDIARDLDRTYYATRLRRKVLLNGKVQPVGPPACPACDEPLAPGRHHGLCDDCRRDRQRAGYRYRYRASVLASHGAADRKWMRWRAEDDVRLTTEPLTLDLAWQLGRTMKSCIVRRQRLRETSWQPSP